MMADLAVELELVTPEGAADPGPETAPAPERFQVVVTCANEQAQKELLERLSTEGFECKGLIV
jgi:hypothetical protein